MAYIALVDEVVKSLPLILVGPILRRVDSSSVAVWVALREARPVKLTVYDMNDKALLAGTTRTREIGKYLHIAVVRAKANASMLGPGVLYQYDLEFDDGERLNSPQVFTEQGGFAKEPGYWYDPFKRPTFVLPPGDWKEIHFLHASCRKMHAPGLDAFAIADLAIAKDAGKALARPQMLFLTGDQIYADDVSMVVLFLLMDVGRALLGRSPPEPFGDYLPTDGKMMPDRRHKLARESCFLTSGQGLLSSHLFRFTEFCAMYVMAWSDLFWPRDNFEWPEYYQDLLKHEPPGEYYQRDKDWYFNTYLAPLTKGPAMNNSVVQRMSARGRMT